MSKIYSVPNQKFSDNYDSVFGKKPAADNKEKLKEELRQKLACNCVGGMKKERKTVWNKFCEVVGRWYRKTR